jgi:hypothetical protein
VLVPAEPFSGTDPEIRHELVPEFHERPPQMLDT